MTVGICGTGKMGSAMAERLMDEGETLAVWNRTPARAAPLIERGARLAVSPAELARDCDGEAPVAKAALSSYEDAVAAGWGERDFPLQAAWRAGRVNGKP